VILEKLTIFNDDETRFINSRIVSLANNELAGEIFVEPINNENIIDIKLKNPKAKQLISLVLSDEIIDFFEKRLMYKIINKSCGAFTNIERMSIYNIANEMVQKDSASKRMMRRDIINKSLAEFLNTSNRLILKGFVKFRLKRYITELEVMVEKAVRQFMVEREHKEFISLLKYFIDIQEPKVKCVHVVVDAPLQYRFFDGKHRDITDDCFKDFLMNAYEVNINYDDLLVSTLITLAPKELYFHHFDRISNKELATTIKQVFEKRIKICDGCKFCKKN
jgi:putative sporulation protein YtxC